MKLFILSLIAVTFAASVSASPTACKNLKSMNNARLAGKKFISCETLSHNGEIRRPDFCIVDLETFVWDASEKSYAIWDDANRVLGFRGGFTSPGPQEWSTGGNIGVKGFDYPIIKFAVNVSNLYGEINYSNDPWFGDRKVIGTATFQCR